MNPTIQSLLTQLTTRNSAGGFPEQISPVAIHLLQSVLTLPMPNQAYTYHEMIAPEIEMKTPVLNVLPDLNQQEE